ncbi:alpha/beta fold hydrolase [Streptomyces sp. NPDC004609]|uniref:alpha/beta fold hydrolase n=1 Tax=Streptomyces sp. NPDC004609 TaxID=3364704 RepID=UPI0036BC0547
MSATTLSAVSADGTRIHTEVYGPKDAPTVVLAHGWTCSTRFWSAQLRDLAAEFRVVVYDQRGHGRTPAAPVGTERLADDLEAVLRATLAPGQKAVLAGHSMGGMALMAASGRPAFTEHAAAVLLCSTGGSHLVEEARVVPLRHGPLRTRLTGSVLGSRAPLGPVTPLSRRILKYATMAPGSTRAQVAECARIVHACPRPVRVAWSRVLAGLDLRSRVRELTVPAVVVTGLADRLTPPVHARRIAATLPDCRELVELPGTGHMTPVEAPEAINAEIRRLLLAHAAGRVASVASSGRGSAA